MDDKKDLILELIKSNKISDARYEITKIEKSGSYEDHELLYYKGIVEKTDKNYSKAIDCFQGSLELVKPNVPLILLLNIADCYLFISDFDKAKNIYDNILKIQNDNLAALNGLGRIYILKKQIKSALSIFKRLYDINPEITETLFNLGFSYYLNNEFSEAISIYKLYKKKIDPKEVNVENLSQMHLYLGLSLLSLNFYQEGLNELNDAEKLSKDDPRILYNIGVANLKIENFDKAEDYFSKVYRIDEMHLANTYNYCNLLLMRGKSSKAKQIVEKIINKSKHYTKFLELAPKLNISTSDNYFKWLKEVFHNNKTDDNEKIIAGFGLFHILDADNDFKNAFNYLVDANKLSKKISSPFLLDEMKKKHNIIKKLFADHRTIVSNNEQLDYPTPIFIVGMPRSGTTLIEQILDSHDDVFGAGELETMGDLAKEFTILENNNTNNIEENIKELCQKYFSYIDSVNKENKPFIVDKMPGNYFWLGLIKKAIPWAKIIHSNRNPLDISLSIFSKRFIGGFTNYYTLDDIANSYICYHELMTHWVDIFPIKDIFRVNYEDLIKDSESNIKKLISFCDLSFSNKCIEFYKNERIVRTASSTQVRKKLYSNSLDRWKNYENELESIILQYKKSGII
tara:strand:+ start:963 stop:2843 length:1881 start_codon:yes stop_codon:yes gene_type:complete